MKQEASSMAGKAKPQKRVLRSGAVDGLPMPKIQAAIQWIGVVRLHQLNEDSESMLAEIEWPVKSGNLVYACASTGLLFDKKSGRCYQSSNVTLKLDTVKPQKCTAGQFSKWQAARILAAPKDITAKRGPKPKGYVPPSDPGDFDE